MTRPSLLLSGLPNRLGPRGGWRVAAIAAAVVGVAGLQTGCGHDGSGDRGSAAGPPHRPAGRAGADFAYTPARSPAALAARSDVVVRGQILAHGRAGSALAVDGKPSRLAIRAADVRVDRVLAGRLADGRTRARLLVWLPYGPVPRPGLGGRSVVAYLRSSRLNRATGRLRLKRGVRHRPLYDLTTPQGLLVSEECDTVSQLPDDGVFALGSALADVAPDRRRWPRFAEPPSILPDGSRADPEHRPTAFCDAWSLPLGRTRAPRGVALRRVPARWQLVGVRAGGRALDVAYLSGGCRIGDGRARVRESRREIRITIVEHERRPRPPNGDLGVLCPGVGRLQRIVVALREPMAGRRVTGPDQGFVSELAGRLRVFPSRPFVVPLVPCVVALAAGDARSLLTRAGFKVRGAGAADATVQRQTPAPGHAFAHRRSGGRAGMVTLITAGS